MKECKNYQSYLRSDGTAFTSEKDCRAYVRDGGTLVTPACSNGIDDDADGKTDYPSDPDCASATENDERSSL